jgi:hypothetical protein
VLDLYAESVVDETRVRARQDAWRVTAPNAQALAALVINGIGEPAIRSLEIRLDTWKSPKGWVGSPGIGGIARLSLEPRGEGVQVELEVAEPVDPGLLVAAAMRILRPHTADVAPLITLTPGLPASARLLALDARDALSAEPAANPHLRRCDTLVISDERRFADVPRSRTVIVEAGAWTIDGERREVVVDPTVHRPVGRRSSADGALGEASVAEGVLSIEGEGVSIRTRDDLTAAQVYRLRALAGVRAIDLPTRWRAQLEACGAIVTRDGIPADALDREAMSVHARRHALRWYSPTAALDAWPTVSIVLVTHRDRFIDHVIAQLARIAYPRLQVVIGLHGLDVPHHRFDALRSLHDVVLEPIDGALPFGSAVQRACDRADGELVTKVDDDDYYGSEHVWDLVLARMYSGAQLVGKALDWVYLEADDVTAFRPVYPAESYSTFVAGGTLLISKADLAAAGGWRPVPKSVDRALIDSVQRAGGLVYRTHGLGYVYVRHGWQQTADVQDAHFLTKTADQRPGLVTHEAFGTR